MTLNRYDAQRDANEPEIVEAFERLGCSVERIAVPCDLIVGYRGRTYLVEVKITMMARLTPAQIKFHREHKGQVDVVYSLDSVVRLVASWAEPIVGRDCRP